MRLLVVSDATATSGLGHVMRSVAVAQAAIARGWKVRHAGEVTVAAGAAALREAGVIPIGSRPTTESIVLEAAALRADVVHVDSYEHHDDLRDLCDAAGIVSSSIEDGVWGRRRAHLIVDPHPRAVHQYRADLGDGRALLGAPFTPLRAEVRAGSVGDPSEIRRVLVLMGGTDATGAGSTVARRLAETGQLDRIDVVGSVPSSASRIRAVPFDPRLSDLVAPYDLVVTAAGTTVWELAAIGVPMAVVQLVDNQAENYGFLVDSGLAAPLGTVAALRGERLPDAALSALLDARRAADSRARGLALVDGEGARRIVTAWEEALVPEARAMPAALSDASILFDWRDDDAARRSSRKTAPLVWADHVAWLRRVLDDPNRTLLLVRAGAHALGTVRFDAPDEDGLREVSITVAPQHRGRGVGAAVLASALEAVVAGGGRGYRAAMRTDNRSSRRLFERQGFETDPAGPQDDGFVHLRRLRSDPS
jgi:spore coat polysaccharide biosynthesis predicted glycosyltransferase SpsG/RimJ/RimL family protein N-acetyltransferase